LLGAGTPPTNILYVTFDHPILKLAGIDAVLDAWREREPKADGIEYLLLDEVQFIRDWGICIKHQVDFQKNRRIAFTGSAMPLVEAGQESGVGRWHTIRLTTLSFYEYLQIKKVSLPDLPELRSLRNLFDWPQREFYRTTELAAPYLGHFHAVRGIGHFTSLRRSAMLLVLARRRPRYTGICIRATTFYTYPEQPRFSDLAVIWEQARPRATPRRALIGRSGASERT
jgi:hypothetical protein